MEIVLKPKQLDRLTAIQVKRDAIRKEIANLAAEEGLVLEVLFEENAVDPTTVGKIDLLDGKLVCELKPVEAPKAKGKNKKAIMEALKK